MLATAGSLYFSEVAHYDPCRLCWYQRIAMYPLAIILAIAARPRRTAGSGSTVGRWRPSARSSPRTISRSSGSRRSTRAPAVSGPSCTVVWFRALGFVSLPFLALSAFLLIFTLLSVRAPNAVHDDSRQRPSPPGGPNDRQTTSPHAGATLPRGALRHRPHRRRRTRVPLAPGRRRRRDRGRGRPGHRLRRGPVRGRIVGGRVREPAQPRSPPWPLVARPSVAASASGASTPRPRPAASTASTPRPRRLSTASTPSSARPRRPAPSGSGAASGAGRR